MPAVFGRRLSPRSIALHRQPCQSSKPLQPIQLHTVNQVTGMSPFKFMNKCFLCISKHFVLFVRNDDARRLMKQPKLTAVIHSRRLTLFGDIARMDDNAGHAKRILLASPPADWRRQPGRPPITWLSTVQHDLKHHHLTLPEAADLAENRRLWRMMSTYCNHVLRHGTPVSPP